MNEKINTIKNNKKINMSKKHFKEFVGILFLFMISMNCRAQSLDMNDNVVGLNDQDQYVTATPNPQDTLTVDDNGDGGCTYDYSYSTYEWAGDVSDDADENSETAYVDTSSISSDIDDHEIDVTIIDHYDGTDETVEEPDSSDD